MRRIFTLGVLRCTFLSAVAVACSVNDVSQKSQTPTIDAVFASTNGRDGDARFCSSEAGQLRIIGSGLAPAPRSVLDSQPTLEAPAVNLVCDSVSTPLTDVLYSIADGSLTARVPTGLPVGTCDVVVVAPTGESTTLAAAVIISAACARLELCGSVSPAYGWVNGRTTIELCANNANGMGLAPVPEVFLRVGADGDGANVVEVPLIREAVLTLSTSAGGFANASVMSATVPSASEARGAGIVAGGPYDIRVVNPDGVDGIIADAFVVLADPPPHITSITPEQADTQTAPLMHIIGRDFKDPATSTAPRVARVLLISTDRPTGADCVAPTCVECASPLLVSATEVTCTPPTAAMSSGSYVVRYEHLLDGSFSDFAAFAVTNPAGNLAQNPTTMPSLNIARFAHGMVSGRDDLGNRFVYVIGGQTDVTAASATATVEVSSLARFGQMGAWTTLVAALPEPRTGAALVRDGSYIFLVGGRTIDGATLGDIRRARILGSEGAPIIDAPTTEASASSTLAAGSYGYRISAIMDATGDNPLGESLASDRESVRVATGSLVHLSWSAVAHAVRYRVYRSAVDAISGSEALLAEVETTSFTDNGAATPNGLVTPYPAGALGVWASVASLATARADHAATIAHNPDGDAFLYVLGGRDDGDATLGSCEYVALTRDADDIPSLGTLESCNGLPSARSELLATTIDATRAPRIDGIGAEYVLATQGIGGGDVSAALHVAKVNSDGSLGTWTEYAGQPSKQRYGASGVLVNNVLFSIGGRGGNDAIETRGLTAPVCEAGVNCDGTDPPVIAWSSGDSGIVLSHPRYRAGLVCEGGLFYFTGGLSSDTTVESSVERGAYQ